MKKFLKACVVVLCMGITTSLSAQSQGGIIGQARAQVTECITPFASSYEIRAFVTETPCSGGGNSTQVSFYAAPRCNPNQFCAQFLIFIAEVNYDCNGNLSTIACSSGGPIEL
jgi:hypothetical protein